MNKLKILVCCHKDVLDVNDEYFFPIHVGKQLSNIDIGIQPDNEGDNISEKNSSFCELTGMYWAWKNMQGVDYIGLCHYRRFFDFHHQCGIYDSKDFLVEDVSSVHLDVPSSVCDYLNKGFVYLAKPRHLRQSVFADYCCMHYSRDIIELENVIKSKDTENKYYSAYYYIFKKNNKFHPYNMFLMRWDLFNDYCSWMFDILFELESRLDISKYDKYQSRIYGFIAERLLNVYIYANHVKVLEKPVISFKDKLDNSPNSFRYLIRKKLNDLAMVMTRPK